jgi:hypothetical protein
MKYKVGDKVKIKDKKQIDFNKSHCVFLSTMKDMLGDDRITTIIDIEVGPKNGRECYVMEGSAYLWDDEMIEYSLSEHEIKKREKEFKSRPIVTRAELLDFED